MRPVWRLGLRSREDHGGRQGESFTWSVFKDHTTDLQYLCFSGFSETGTQCPLCRASPKSHKCFMSRTRLSFSVVTRTKVLCGLMDRDPHELAHHWMLIDPVLDIKTQQQGHVTIYSWLLKVHNTEVTSNPVNQKLRLQLTLDMPNMVVSGTKLWFVIGSQSESAYGRSATRITVAHAKLQSKCLRWQQTELKSAY